VKYGRRIKVCLVIALSGLHMAILLAGFFSPYDPAQQNRNLPYAPPTRIHSVDTRNHIRIAPFVCAFEDRLGTPGEYFENQEKCAPIRFLVRGARYRLIGPLHANVHLFGVEAPAEIHLMGTDAFGRDVFSRFLYGGQISLLAGVLATLLTLVCGTFLGTVAGYYGGCLDAFIMRAAELFLALPWLYLLFAVRAFLPLSLSGAKALLLLVGVIGLVGWARPARMIRGVVLSSRERHYVFAARLFGASDTYLMRRHVLPDLYSIILTQAALLIPQYVLAEVVLSFLGLGVGEPTASWGNMLSALHQYAVLVSYWWMLMPGLLLVPVFLAYSLLASYLHPGRVAERA
jgi:peptide/nickel transport system permease protein